MADAAGALATAAGWAMAGALAWSLAEYVLHRWDMHGRRSRGATSREHRRHHATADIPVIAAGAWVGAALVAAFLAWVAHPAAGAGWMAAYVAYELLHRHLHAMAPPNASGAATTAGDGSEPRGTDRRVADRPTTPGRAGRRVPRPITGRRAGPRGGATDGEPPQPLGAYGRWAQGHHFHHHFVDARANYGVTSPLWDVVLRTRRPGAGQEGLVS